MSLTDDLQIQLNRLKNGDEYAAQRQFDDGTWSVVMPIHVCSLAEAKADAKRHLEYAKTVRIVKISKYVTGDSILIKEIMQVMNKKN